MTSSREAWIDLTTDARLPTQALYQEDKADRYSHHLCLQRRSALNRPLAGSSVITMTTAELANIPLFKALIEAAQAASDTLGNIPILQTTHDMVQAYRNLRVALAALKEAGDE